jgi:hypothetical protein
VPDALDDEVTVSVGVGAVDIHGDAVAVRVAHEHQTSVILERAAANGHPKTKKSHGGIVSEFSTTPRRKNTPH